jgi:hypothetical protein
MDTRIGAAIIGAIAVIVAAIIGVKLSSSSDSNVQSAGSLTTAAPTPPATTAPAPPVTTAPAPPATTPPAPPTTTAVEPIYGLITNLGGYSSVYINAAPTAASARVGLVYGYTRVEVICAVQGQTAVGGGGTTNIWYEIYYYGRYPYILANYVNIGTEQPRPC